MESGYVSSLKHEKRKVFRDNVHGYIDVPCSVVSELIDTPLFQRLRNIEQTSMRPLFPSARHDRFIHSLGTYYLGAKAFDSLEYNARINGELDGLFPKGSELDIFLRRRRELFLIACLLHDCGHAPFSHTFEIYYTLDMTNDESESRLEAEIKKEYLEDNNFAKDLKILCEEDGGPAPHELMSALLVGRYFRKKIESVFSTENLEIPSDEEFALMARMIIGCTYRGPISEEKSFDNCLVSLLNSSTIDVDGLDYSMRDSVNSGIPNSSIDYDRLLGSLSVPIACHFGSVSSEDGAQEYVEIKEASFRGIFSRNTELRARENENQPDCSTVNSLSGNFTFTFFDEDSAKFACEYFINKGINACYEDREVIANNLYSVDLPKNVEVIRLNDSPCSLTLNKWTGKIKGDILRSEKFIKDNSAEVKGKLSRLHVLAFGKSSMISLEGAINARNLLYRQIYAHPQVLYRSSFLLKHMLKLTAKYLCCRYNAKDFDSHCYPPKTCLADECPIKKRVLQERNTNPRPPKESTSSIMNSETVISEILGSRGFMFYPNMDGDLPRSGACSQWHFNMSDDCDVMAIFKWVYFDNHARPDEVKNKEIERYFGEYFGRTGKKPLWKSYEEYRHFLSVHHEEGLEEIDFQSVGGGSTSDKQEYVLLDDIGDEKLDSPIGKYMKAGYKGLLVIKASQKVKALNYNSTFVKFPDGIERFSDVAGFLPPGGKNEFCYLFCDSGPGIPEQ